jgi:catechol 2,3-dioxygenase-like lactoylglutathione lyase family enzyme
MDLGAFSVSLAVKDLKTSLAFYANLGFEPLGNAVHDNWAIIKNGDHVIGLFQDMFDKNILTFNPGWDQAANPLESFTDVREIQRVLKSAGVKLDAEADDPGQGPGSCMLTDPDGNPILIDQHR